MGVIGLAEGVSKMRTSLELDVNPHKDGFSSVALALGMCTPIGVVFGAGIPSWGAEGQVTDLAWGKT